MVGLWVSERDWQKILHGVPAEHFYAVKSYLMKSHYRVVGFLHVVKRYHIGTTEGLSKPLTANQSLLVGKRYVAVCKARKRSRKVIAITTLPLILMATATYLIANNFI
jgi:hypothetical protein